VEFNCEDIVMALVDRLNRLIEGFSDRFGEEGGPLWKRMGRVASDSVEDASGDKIPPGEYMVDVTNIGSRFARVGKVVDGEIVKVYQVERSDLNELGLLKSTLSKKYA
jgi:hypothetical protein